MNLDELKSVILETLSEHVAPSRLKDAIVLPEVDADGEPVLRVRAVVDTSGPYLSSDQVFSATGKLRDALEAKGELRFPLISFPSSNEDIPGVAA